MAEFPISQFDFSHSSQGSFADRAKQGRQAGTIQNQNSFRAIGLLQAFFPEAKETPEALATLAEQVRQGQSLREAFGYLAGRQQQEIQNRLGSSLEEIFSLAANPDEASFWEGALQFGSRLRKLEKQEAAAAVFGILSQVPAGVSEKAKAEFNAIAGVGSSALRTEFLLANLAKQASDYRTIVPVIGGTVLGQAVGTTVLGRLAGSTTTSLFTRGAGARLAAGTASLLVEAPAFALGSRYLSGTTDTPWQNDLARAALSLGTMRAFAFAGNQAFLKIHKVNELGAASRLTGFSKFTQAALPQAAMFAGMYGAHHFEEAVNLRKVSDGATTATDILASMVSIQVGTNLGHRFLGPGFAALQREMGMRAEIYTKHGESTGSASVPSTQSIGNSHALTIGGRKLAPAVGPVHELSLPTRPKPMAMATLGGSGGGKGTSSETIPIISHELIGLYLIDVAEAMVGKTIDSQRREGRWRKLAEQYPEYAEKIMDLGRALQDIEATKTGYGSHLRPLYTMSFRHVLYENSRELLADLLFQRHMVAPGYLDYGRLTPTQLRQDAEEIFAVLGVSASETNISPGMIFSKILDGSLKFRRGVEVSSEEDPRVPAAPSAAASTVSQSTTLMANPFGGLEGGKDLPSSVAELTEGSGPKPARAKEGDGQAAIATLGNKNLESVKTTPGPTHESLVAALELFRPDPENGTIIGPILQPISAAGRPHYKLSAAHLNKETSIPFSRFLQSLLGAANQAEASRPQQTEIIGRKFSESERPVEPPRTMGADWSYEVPHANGLLLRNRAGKFISISQFGAYINQNMFGDDYNVGSVALDVGWIRPDSEISMRVLIDRYDTGNVVKTTAYDFQYQDGALTSLKTLLGLSPQSRTIDTALELLARVYHSGQYPPDELMEDTTVRSAERDSKSAPLIFDRKGNQINQIRLPEDFPLDDGGFRIKSSIWLTWEEEPIVLIHGNQRSLSLRLMRGAPFCYQGVGRRQIPLLIPLEPALRDLLWEGSLKLKAGQ